MARKVSLLLSHWNKLIEGLQESPQQFYSSLEKAIERREIPNTNLSRIDYREGGVFSAKREYLRVRRKEHLFDICAAPFGTGFFFSWWLGESVGFFYQLMLKIPILGRIFVRLLRKETYYKIDTALMFQGAVHSAVLEVIDEITKTNGLRALSEAERKPILTDLFRR